MTKLVARASTRLDVRSYNATHDRAMVEKWWRAHGWEPIPSVALPKLGLIVEARGVGPVCIGWLYRTDSAICHIEWILRNPDATREDMDGAIRHLVDRLCHFARIEGFSLVYMSVKHKRLIETLTSSCAFEVQEDATMTGLIRKL